MNQTLNYYNQNATEFFNATLNVDMESLYQAFIQYLPQDALILDLGCGSGRDTLAFKRKGYRVEALDYSKELVALASHQTGQQVRLESFYDFSDQSKFNGIWACASLLHCERHQLNEVVGRMINALKLNGVLYMSFKYGENDREKDGRQFTDLNEQQAQDLLSALDGVLLLQQWITLDKRPDRTEEWLNILLKKQVG
ncbi:class I SAM-dependent methyltransferase [Acinetobacter kanungonis]|uniref:class I SAM-dependent methyltransferase n=1 Tax=Acinetobacter kanungonis TaxID=2699469 RepID=UPI00137AF629|nr:class I SAM-dependent methyltransferase [Acinetobacter kanungonis]NCI77300.1 class I SAM-dependent methyltransferase [Acinetobacter kanungonis]